MLYNGYGNQKTSAKRVAKNIKIDDSFSDESFKKGIEKVADEIYKSINLSTSKNSSKIKETKGGGVILAF